MISYIKTTFEERNSRMKKLISLFLCLVLCVTAAVPAFAWGGSQEIYVSSDAELRSAIGSDRTVILSAGEYVFDRELEITGVRNLTLRGDGSSSILITDGNDQVLFLSECSGITLENLTLGHRVTPDEGCSNGVLYMWGVDGLTVTNCDIFGCGIEGINASSCSDLWFENTTVRDCSEDIMGLGETGATFRNCTFSGNAYVNSYGLPAISLWESYLSLENCVFRNNRNTVFYDSSDNSSVTQSGCTFSGNGWGGDTAGDSGSTGNTGSTGGTGNTGSTGGTGSGAAYETVSGFGDVFWSDYYAEAVQWAVDTGVTTGTSAATFSPYDTVTRGQAVTFLWRACGQPEPESYYNPFWDVHEWDYFYKAVLWAVENGITNGTGAGTFSPSTSVTRGQMITFLWRTCGKPGDSGSSVWYEDAENWASWNGILSGTAEGYATNASCPRSDVVFYIWKS